MNIDGKNRLVTKSLPIQFLRDAIKYESGVNFAVLIHAMLRSSENGIEKCSRARVAKETGYSVGRISRARTSWHQSHQFENTGAFVGRKKNIPERRVILPEGLTKPFPIALRTHIWEFDDAELRLLCLLFLEGILLPNTMAWVQWHESNYGFASYLADSCSMPRRTAFHALRELKRQNLIEQGYVRQLTLGEKEALGIVSTELNQKPIIVALLPQAWLADCPILKSKNAGT